MGSAIRATMRCLKGRTEGLLRNRLQNKQVNLVSVWLWPSQPYTISARPSGALLPPRFAKPLVRQPAEPGHNTSTVRRSRRADRQAAETTPALAARTATHTRNP